MAKLGLIGAIGGLGTGATAVGQTWYQDVLQKERDARIEEAKIRSEGRFEDMTVRAEGRAAEAEGVRYTRNRGDAVSDMHFGAAGKTVGRVVGPDGRLQQMRRTPDGESLEKVTGPAPGLIDDAKASGRGGKPSDGPTFTHKDHGGQYTEKGLWDSYQRTDLNRSGDTQELNAMIDDWQMKLAMEQEKSGEEQDAAYMSELQSNIDQARSKVSRRFSQWLDQTGYRLVPGAKFDYVPSEGDLAGNGSKFDGLAAELEAGSQSPNPSGGLVTEAQRTQAEDIAASADHSQPLPRPRVEGIASRQDEYQRVTAMEDRRKALEREAAEREANKKVDPAHDRAVAEFIRAESYINEMKRDELEYMVSRAKDPNFRRELNAAKLAKIDFIAAQAQQRLQ